MNEMGLMVHVDAGSASALLPQRFRNFDRSEPPVSIMIDLSCTPQLQDEAHHFVLSPNSSSLIAAVECVGNLVIGPCRSAAFASLLLLLWQLSSGLPEGLLLRATLLWSKSSI